MTFALKGRSSITEQVPTTFATSTLIRCCGVPDQIAMKDLLMKGWRCAICGREIPARGNVLANQGKKIKKIEHWK